jgi:uncharacterized membrane protein YjgN (DUF898 family)
MSPTPVTPSSRPRAVNVAFWCWLAADVLTAAFGLLLITSPAPTFIRAVGGLIVVVGVAHGFLTGQTRSGKKRFAFAAVALAMTTVAFMAVLLLFGASLVGILIVAVIMILMIAGSSLVRGKAAQAWLDDEDAS